MTTSETIFENDFGYHVSDKVYKSSKNSRALEILGYDFLLKDETIFQSNDDIEYVPTLTKDKDISTSTALMNIYKALGEYEYDIRYVYREDPSIIIEESPIQQYLLNRYSNIDTSDGACYVWMSRSNSSLYEVRAVNDNLSISGTGINTILSKSEAGTVKVTKKPDIYYEAITLGDFCRYLKELMVRYGEPVMTAMEESTLISMYGTEIPYYIANDSSIVNGYEIVEAIKYLYAKGVLNPEQGNKYKFASELTMDDMLEILMAVKDTDSRYTFKQVELTLDSKLAEKGYYPSTISGNTSPIETMTSDDTAGASYFDYLVEAKDGVTNFIKDNAILDTFVLISNDGNKLKYKDDSIFEYKGITDDGYYHFRIKVNKESLESYLYKDKYFKISTVDKCDVKYYRIPYGGGVYKANVYSNKKLKSLETSSFDYIFGLGVHNNYVDSRRKLYAQSQAENDMLAARTYASIKFSIAESTWKENISKICIKENKDDKSGTSLADLETNDSIRLYGKYTITKQTSVNGLRYFVASGFADMADFREHISHTDISGRYGEYEVFCKKGDTLLVNYDYLQDLDVAKRYIELENNTLMLITPYNNIYLCNDTNRVVVGNIVYEVPSDTILWYKIDNKIFVDYRAALGWAGDYFIFQEQSGEMVATLPTKLVSSGGGAITTKQIYNPMGGNTSSSKYGSNVSSLPAQTVVYDNKLCLLLSSNYPLANYFIFDGDADSNSKYGDSDYLFVFKEKNTNYKNKAPVTDLYQDDKVSREILSNATGITAPESWLVYAYILYKEPTLKAKNPPGIYYSKFYGYIYEPTEYKSTWIQDYYSTPMFDQTNLKGTQGTYSGANDRVLPFMLGQKQGADQCIYNINFNTFQYKSTKLTYGRAPYNLLMPEKAKYEKRAVTWKPGYNFNDIGDSNITKLENYTISPAPTGIMATFLDAETISISDLTNKSYSLYFGTLKLKVNKNKLSISTSKLGSIGEPNFTDFTILRTTNLGYVLGTKNDISLEMVNTESDNSSSKHTLGLGESLKLVDWEAFRFNTLLSHADDLLTILLIIVLNFLPRVFIFSYLTLIALSVVRDNKLLIKFCDNIVDPFKILTLWQRDVHTIDTYTMFWASILGIAISGLFMDGTILNLFAWVSEIITRIGN